VVKDIARAISKEFEVQERKVEKDILELLGDLLREGLVGIYESPAKVTSD
jgi:hypothetical protein